MSTQTQTLMEKLVTEIDTKNSWGKNQLVETSLQLKRMIQNKTIQNLKDSFQFFQLKGYDKKGNIRFTGKITDSSCDITQKDKDVYLGEHSVAKLKKNDDRTEEKAFDIYLINCSLAMKSLKIKMECTAHADNATLYALDANEKSAGKVGISIATAEGQQVTPAGDYRDIPLKADSRDYTLNYTAAYQATGLATPGEGNATVNYTVSYE